MANSIAVFYFGSAGVSEQFDVHANTIFPEVVVALDGNDIIIGSTSDELLGGGFGTDLVFGSGGTDTIYGDNSPDPDDLGGAADMVIGGPGTDVIFAGAGNDFASGNSENDFVDGGGGDDFVWGGTGADVLRGGAGNDVIHGGTAATFPASFSLSFVVTFDGANFSDIPDFTVDSASALPASVPLAPGDTGNDDLSGGDGNDELHGQLGSDTLTGGPGDDLFFFETALDAAANVDTVFDFSHKRDTMELSKTIFDKLPFGTLAPAKFHIGNKAGDADDRIVYNANSGAVFYDPDGTGALPKTKFALLGDHLNLDQSDFVVVA